MVSSSLSRLALALALGGLLAAGCKKDQSQQQQGQAQPGGINVQLSQGGGPMPAGESDVTRYSDEGPEIGSSTIKRQGVARRSADQASEILGHLGVGTLVNKKARHGAYYLVEFPTGPGQMRLGWILQDDVNTVTHAATTTPPIVTTAPATTTAPTLKLPPRPIKIGK